MCSQSQNAVVKHGQERNRTIKRTHATLAGTTKNGEAVQAAYCDSELSVAEKFCQHCDEFVSTESLGLIGFVMCPQCKSRW